MEVDNGCNNGPDHDFSPEKIIEMSLSFPRLLKAFMNESNNYDSDHKLIVVAVHAVMLDSGFVAFDQYFSESVVPGPPWPWSLFTVSLFYTLPEIIANAATLGHSINKTSIFVLKFRSYTGRFFIDVTGKLIRYGLGNDRSCKYRVNLNVDNLVRCLNVRRANCDVVVDQNIAGDFMAGTSRVENKTLNEFWTTVKDGIALPLLIHLREEAGLEIPPCFMRLPSELKLKIIEYLPGVYVAIVSSLCSELRRLGSSDELWKMKCDEMLTLDRGIRKPHQGWKKAFAAYWKVRTLEMAKNRELEVQRNLNTFMGSLARRMRELTYGQPVGFSNLRDDYYLNCSD